MEESIKALYALQQRDRQLTVLERRLSVIPGRIKELDDDLAKLKAMLDAEREKCEQTRAFQRSQESQLADEEEMLRNSRARLQQVKNARELNATQREIDQTRRMASARSEEIQKLQGGVAEAEQRIAAMTDSLESLRAQADAEKERLTASQGKMESKLGRLREGRSDLTKLLEPDVLRMYDRIRRRVGGIAFVPANNGRCTACKMHIPHQTYVMIKKAEAIPNCESCGRLLYFEGFFPKEDEDKGPKPKASPPQRRGAPKD